MKESTNYRTMNVKLRRIDVNRLCILLAAHMLEDETECSWMKDVHDKLREQREQFDKKLEEEENERKTV